MKPNKIDFFSSPANNSIGLHQVEDPPKHENFNQYNNPYDDFKTPKREPQFLYTPIHHNRTEFAQNLFLDDPQSYFLANKRDQIRTEKRTYKIQRKLSYNQKQQESQILSLQQQLKEAKCVPADKNILQKQQAFFNKNLKNYDFYTPSKKSNAQNVLSQVSQRSLKGQVSQRSLKGCEKGLRRLSYLSFQIVNQLGSTSYKQVAQRLLQKMNITEQLYLDEDRQDRSGMRNVKRRVYDSLNVLIALGVLTRNGNRIVRNKPKKQSLMNLDQQAKRNTMQAQMTNKQFILRHKKMIFQQLKSKSVMLNKILQRNRMMIRKERIAQFQGEKINFPFVVIVNDQAQQQGKIKLQSLVQTKKKESYSTKTQKKATTISSVDLQLKGKVCAFGDLDSMSYLVQYQNQARLQHQLQEKTQFRMAEQKRKNMQRQREFQRFAYFRKDSICQQKQYEDESPPLSIQEQLVLQIYDERNIKNQQQNNLELQQKRQQYVDPQRLIDEVFNHTPQQHQ